MDLASWQTLGVVVGAALSSFAASWVTIGRPLKRQLDEVSEPSPKLALLEQRVGGIETTVNKLDTRVEQTEKRVSNTITDEEFATYTNHTTKSVQTLTEKVGHVTGALEAWYRQPGKHQ